MLVFGYSLKHEEDKPEDKRGNNAPTKTLYNKEE
jgi:hypothetical protein